MDIKEYFSMFPEEMKEKIFNIIKENGDNYVKAVQSIQNGNLKSAKKAYKLVDKDIKKSIKYNPVTCKKGCSYCCFVQIDITQDEAQLIINHCNHNKIKIDIDKLNEQKNFTVNDWVIQPIENAKCIFLKNNLCSIYKVRPLSCRKYLVASDPKLCDITTGINKVSILNNIELELFVAGIYNVREVDSLPKMILKYIK